MTSQFPLARPYLGGSYEHPNTDCRRRRTKSLARSHAFLAASLAEAAEEAALPVGLIQFSSPPLFAGALGDCIRGI
jgi:hypothetical protein